MNMNLDEEASQVTKMLKNKTVDIVLRYRKKEVCIQFSDGTRFFVNHTPTGLELSITDKKGK